ncbi:hypothetical protein EVAR_50316_1 [Eumeta japonica]|uniref:Uncharacterized protein n=1 Tax=Eumeta variegata TaxID=151549 RepID=A0A4C2A2B7_EUMVA|nr:hypothetical protein EVAR_50316_1 [Eumeta japonica]
MRPPHKVPDNDRPSGRRTRTRAVSSSAGAASQRTGQARAGHPSQGLRRRNAVRKAKREAEAENRSIPTPASPSIRRPPTDTNGAANATDSSHAAPDNAADPPATSGNATDGPTNLRAPLAKVTRLPQLVVLTWMQARVMEALQAILTGKIRSRAATGKIQDLRTLVSRRTYLHTIVLLGETQIRPDNNSGCPTFLYRRDEVSPARNEHRHDTRLMVQGPLPPEPSGSYPRREDVGHEATVSPPSRPAPTDEGVEAPRTMTRRYSFRLRTDFQIGPSQSYGGRYSYPTDITKADVAASLIIKMQATRHRGRHGRVCLVRLRARRTLNEADTRAYHAADGETPTGRRENDFKSRPTFLADWTDHPDEGLEP